MLDHLKSLEVVEFNISHIVSSDTLIVFSCNGGYTDNIKQADDCIVFSYKYKYRKNTAHELMLLSELGYVLLEDKGYYFLSKIIIHSEQTNILSRFKIRQPNYIAGDVYVRKTPNGNQLELF